MRFIRWHGTVVRKSAAYQLCFKKGVKECRKENGEKRY